jgi:hypothetical protein
LLDELIGVRVDVDRMAGPLKLPYPPHDVIHVLRRPVEHRAEDLAHAIFQAAGQVETQAHLGPVINTQRQIAPLVCLLIWLLANRLRTFS